MVNKFTHIVCLIVLFIFSLIIFFPILAGILGIFLPSFGYSPILGGDFFTLNFFYKLYYLPGIKKSFFLSFFTGFTATFFSLLFSQLIILYLFNTKIFNYIKFLIAPLIAFPHVTMAVGLLFLFSPSGLIIRLLSPWLLGFDRPPDFYIIPDSYGFSLILGLIIKEIPFFLLISISMLDQFPANKILKVGRSLQHSIFSSCFLLIFPLFYKRI